MCARALRASQNVKRDASLVCLLCLSVWVGVFSGAEGWLACFIWRSPAGLQKDGKMCKAPRNHILLFRASCPSYAIKFLYLYHCHTCFRYIPSELAPTCSVERYRMAASFFVGAMSAQVFCHSKAIRSSYAAAIAIIFFIIELSSLVTVLPTEHPQSHRSFMDKNNQRSFFPWGGSSYG